MTNQKQVGIFVSKVCLQAELGKLTNKVNRISFVEYFGSPVANAENKTNWSTNILLQEAFILVYLLNVFIYFLVLRYGEVCFYRAWEFSRHFQIHHLISSPRFWEIVRLDRVILTVSCHTRAFIVQHVVNLVGILTLKRTWLKAVSFTHTHTHTGMQACVGAHTHTHVPDEYCLPSW